MAKKKWTSARQGLYKAVLKDSINPGVEYVFAEYFFNPDNPEYQIDSSYNHILKALRQFSRIPNKEKDRLARIRVDSMTMIRMRQALGTAAFERATRINTEAAFLHFLGTYSFASERDEAIRLRDEAAYQDAVKANSYEAFHLFIEKYPASVRQPEALKAYHELLFKEKTADKTLSGYELFLKQYPESPYRSFVEKQIFMIFTASGRPEKYFEFLKKYPSSPEGKTARNILFHQFGQDSPVVEEFLNDSLRLVRSLNREILIPVRINDKFGFMDPAGKIVIQPFADSIAASYKCGNVMEDVLIADNAVVARNGKKIFTGNIDTVEDLGEGFLLIEAAGCSRVIHKSGFQVTGCVDDARLISQNFIAARKNNRWAIVSFSSSHLTAYEWEDISSIKNIILFKKNNKYLLTTVEQAGLLADKVPMKASKEYDEVRPWSHELIWLRSGDMEEVIDQHLNMVVKSDKHRLIQTPFGIIAKSNVAGKLFTRGGHLMTTFKDYIIRDHWFLITRDSLWKFFDPATSLTSGRAYDSVFFTGPFPHATRRDSVDIFFSPARWLSFSGNVRSYFIPAKDSTAVLVVQTDNKKTVYNGKGRPLFSDGYDDIQNGGEGYFIVSKKEKKGLVSSDGKLVLPPVYDAIGNVSRGVVSLLKAMKFGAYNIGMRELIKPQYDKNLSVFNDNILSAYQKGYYGFIDWQNKAVSKAEFDEISHWTDTVALVKKGSFWQLFDTNTYRVIEDAIHEMRYLYETQQEKLAIVKQDNAYGVLSNRKGFIIPPTFTFVSNVGSADQPVYFTEKHVEEASIFVVIYYDSNGQMLLRQVYEEKDYRKIVCGDN